MTARALGAFLLAFFAFGYLLGPDAGGSGLLLSFGLAAAVAALVAWWLRDGREEPGDVDVFDVKATRRAVRRGVARTALTAVVWVAAGFIVVGFASNVWHEWPGRESRFERVAGLGFLAGHLGYRSSSGPFCCSGGLRDMELGIQVEPRTASSQRETRTAKLRLDLRGRVTVPDSDLSPAPVQGALDDLPPPKAQTRALLARLPEQVTTVVIVELRRALSIASFRAFFARHEPSTTAGFPSIPILLEPRAANLRHVDGSLWENRVGWPAASVAEFQAWAKRLRGDDDGTLDRLYLPPAEKIRFIAARARIYGFIVEGARPPSLLALLGDPKVRGVKVVDVAFDLTLPPAQQGAGG